MKLTWRDAAVTAVTAAVVILFLGFLSGADLPFVSSPRVLGVTILVLGFVGCAVGAAGAPQDKQQGAQQGTQRWMTTPWTVLFGLLGSVALLSAALVLITGNEVVLAVLVGTTVALWLAATIRHLFAAGDLEPVPHDKRLIEREEHRVS